MHNYINTDQQQTTVVQLSGTKVESTVEYVDLEETLHNKIARELPIQQDMDNKTVSRIYKKLLSLIYALKLTKDLR